MYTKLLATVLLTVAVSACASGSAWRNKQTYHSSINLISHEEILRSGAGDALNLIQNLRPRWLMGHGPVSLRSSQAEYPIIYLNGVLCADIQVLGSIPVQDIAEIRYLTGTDASMRYAISGPGGVIALKMVY